MLKYFSLVMVSAMLLMASCAAQVGSKEAEPSLIPWPKAIDMASGSLTLDAKSRIVYTDDKLEPLANILSGEINDITGFQPAVVKGPGGNGDIVLQLDPSLESCQHKVTVADNVLVQGGDYVAVCMGTAVVLQAIDRTPAPTAQGAPAMWTVSLPHMTVRDNPYPQYTGMMLDVARQFNSIDSIKSCVELARLYKMKYFHLHLTDDQLFTFPSTKYPKLKGVYTLDELRDLVKYADQRGVTIIPEFEMPGHSSALAAPYTDVFKDTEGCVIDFIDPKAVPMLSDIVNEMCDIFQSSPYFHMGSDESNFVLFEKWPDVIADREKYHRHTQDQHAWLINQIDEVVKKRGKKLIVWEGFTATEVNKDVTVMEWDGEFFPPFPITQAGYKIINVPWEPSVGWPAVDNYDGWNMWQVGSQNRDPDQFPIPTDHMKNPADDPVIGGQMVLWENGGDMALPLLRGTGVARHERIHSPFAGKTFADFDRRFAHTDQILDLLVSHFDVKADGLTSHTDHYFDKTATLTMTVSPAIKDGVIRYTLDGKAPTDKSSQLYGAPIVLTKTTEVKAQLFDAGGKAIGYPRYLQYFLKPLSAKSEGLIRDTIKIHAFSDPATVTLASGLPGTIRYTLDGNAPTDKSTEYEHPIQITKGSVQVKAQLFGADGNAVGEPWAEKYTWVNYQKNLTTGKPVTASSSQGYPPENAVSGFVELDKAWWAGPYPQWLQIDLEKPTMLDRVQVFPYWDKVRYYQYNVELSLDGKTWTKVVDMSTNTKIATEEGDMHKFPAMQARYIRVNMLKNSANEGVHLVQVRAFSPE